MNTTAQLNPSEKPGASALRLIVTPLCEFCDWRGAAPRIDRQQGILHGVKILGLRSQNGRVYLPEALAAAVSLYEGAKVNVNHPKGHPRAPRDYQERLGSLHDVTVRPGDGLYGDFHFNPRHALAEQLLWDAANAPQNVGFSHNVEARTARRDQQTVVEAITRVVSVDLVADPATTAGLFEAAAAATDVTVDDALSTLTCEQLRVARPDLVEALLLETRDTWRQLNDENAALREQVDQLRHEAEETSRAAALSQRRAQVAALLAEHGLPPAESDDPAARAITSDAFVVSLLEAADEAAMRQLITERAELVEAARRATSPTRSVSEAAAACATPSRPISRTPRVESTVASLDTLAFVRAVRG